MRAACISIENCQYKTDTGYCGYTGNGCAQNFVHSVRIDEPSYKIIQPDEPSYKIVRQLDVSDESIEKIAETVAKKLYQQEADVKYVTRCKDCAMWKKWDQRKNLGNYGECTFWALENKGPMDTKPNDFCSYAKHKEETEEEE